VVTGATTVVGSVVLDTTTNVIEAAQTKLDDVEGIQYPDGGRQLGGQRSGITPRP
jgi:hypothetical protein